MSYRPSPFPRRSVSSVAPFTVKRKQINYEGLEMGSMRAESSSQCSLTNLAHANTCSKPEDLVRSILEGKSVAELNAKIQQLENDLKYAVYEQQKWRHRCRLMETEREKFEASIQVQCDKDKELLETEIKVLKETHLSKVQDLSSTIGRLQKTIDALRTQLGKHDIAEESCSNDDEAIETILGRMNYTEEAEFIKSAYHSSKSARYGANLELLSDIQKTTHALKHEIDLFHARRIVTSVVRDDLMKVVTEDDQASAPTNSGVSAIRKSLFGRKGSGKRK